MKNAYKKNDLYTIIFVEKDTDNYEVLIDTEDFDKINSIKNSWRIFLSENKFYVKTNYTKNKEVITISLAKLILDINGQEHIKFLNKNRLDFRKSNLITNKDFSPNEYKLKKNGEIEIILTDYNEKEKARTIIDIDDLEKVLSHKYRWKYSIINGNPCVYSNGENGEKIYIEHLLLNTTHFVKHLNKNNLDNRKINLKINKKRKKKRTSSKRNNTKTNNSPSINKYSLNENAYNYIEDKDFDFNF